MTTRFETVNNPRVERLTVGELAEDTSYEYTDDEVEDRVLALNYDEVVVITGDLETFARNVWSAVFDQDASTPINVGECGRHGGPWGSDETCQDCVDDEGRIRCNHNDQRLNENSLVVCNDCGQTLLPTND